MEIIELSELQFKNYSNIHSNKNYKQSIEYATLEQSNGYNKVYLGLIDENKDVYAATLILEKKLNNKFKYGYVPNGYLIDYNNKNLLKSFTEELKIYLKKNNYVYIRLTPQYNYQIYSNNFILKENNTIIINAFKELGYVYIDNNAKNKMKINSNNINETYNNFRRSLKRNINDCLKKGINIYQGNSDNLNDFLNLIEDENYYKNMANIFNNSNNKFEFYLASIDPATYINNYRYLLKKEQVNNELLNKKLKNPNIKKTNNLISKKMTSDRLITKYNNEIINGTNIYKEYPSGVIIGGVGIINNGKEIIFITEGHNNNFPKIRSNCIIKWEIIKKYITSGYNKFDLGDIYISKDYTSKLGYSGDIIEYSNTFDLVINDMLYKIYSLSKKKNI